LQGEEGVERDTDGSPGNASGAISTFRKLARHSEVSAWRGRLQRLLPYLVGGAMFAFAVWVLHSALRRYDLADLQAELVALTSYQVGLAIVFTFGSFLALVGYEWSALGLVGKRVPFGPLMVASFATQSIAHSTGFAFVIGATLRYHFYSDRGLGITDVALVQMYFTATFTLGVATLAGAVVMVEPWRLAAATGMPPFVWRVAAATALSLVIAYVVWGGFFHRPLRWRGRELVLPSASATLTQIFFGVADLVAVAAALYVLLPAELGLGYLEVLAVFMASIVIGLVSHVPGSLGVFESAVVLLLQPTEAQTLPLIGSLLAFRAVYYLLPLACGIVVLAVSEIHRWRTALFVVGARLRLGLGSRTTDLAAMLVAVAGIALIAAAITQGSRDAAEGHAPIIQDPYRLSRAVETIGGGALVFLSWGIWQRVARAWRSVMALLLICALAALTAGAPAILPSALAALALLLLGCRPTFHDRGDRVPSWQAPALALLLVLTLASSFWLMARG
jgi:uncharacterized membrane protein YbhN (UPF0104 family)